MKFRLKELFSNESLRGLYVLGKFIQTPTELRGNSQNWAFIKLNLSKKIITPYNFNLSSFLLFIYLFPSGHGCISDALLNFWDVSYNVSETSQRGLICKSLRRLRGDWLKTSPQRRLCDLSGFLRDVFG